jgi:hypothetical protein
VETSEEIAELDRNVDGWAKIKPASHYAGVSERTFRTWLKSGLPHSRLPSGTILIRYGEIDKFLEGFLVNVNETDWIVDGILKEMKGEF